MADQPTGPPPPGPPPPPPTPPVQPPTPPLGPPQPPMPPPGMPLRPSYQPHRATLILVLGILSLVVCAFLGPVAWVMGNRDLAEIDAGRMDPSGRDQTNIGRILGIIGSVLMILAVIGTILWFALIAAMIGTGAMQQ